MRNVCTLCEQYCIILPSRNKSFSRNPFEFLHIRESLVSRSLRLDTRDSILERFEHRGSRIESRGSSFECQLTFERYCTHIAGKLNPVADALSHFNFQEFHLLVSHAASAATPIPADLLEEFQVLWHKNAFSTSPMGWPHRLGECTPQHKNNSLNFVFRMAVRSRTAPFSRPLSKP